jgi:predicted ArsR family transcriptional regulator
MSETSYPHRAGFKDDGTGKEAAEAYGDKAVTNRSAVLIAVERKPGTAEQIGERIGLHWYLTRPRLSELKAMGLIVKTGERGKGALGGAVNVWRATTAEERALFNARKAAEAEKTTGDA